MVADLIWRAGAEGDPAQSRTRCRRGRQSEGEGGGVRLMQTKHGLFGAHRPWCATCAVEKQTGDAECH